MSFSLNAITLVSMIVAIIIFTTISVATYQQGDENSKDIGNINGTLVRFIKNLDERALVQNVYRNTSLHQQNMSLQKQNTILTSLLSQDANLTKLLRDRTSLFNKIIEVQNIIQNTSNKSLYNQEHLFLPYFNRTFTTIFNKLDNLSRNNSLQ